MITYFLSAAMLQGDRYNPMFKGAMAEMLMVINFLKLIFKWFKRFLKIKCKKCAVQHIKTKNNISVSGSIRNDHAMTSLLDWIHLNQEQSEYFSKRVVSNRNR